MQYSQNQKNNNRSEDRLDSMDVRYHMSITNHLKLRTLEARNFLNK